MSFGQTLRTAREAKGLSTSELASHTHLLVQIVEGLENEDFRRIPAPIYGRGFVKLYCEVVGLDPKPLQAEFMALYKLGKEAPAKASGPTPPPPQPPPPPRHASEPEPEAAPDLPPATLEQRLPLPEQTPVIAETPSEEPEPPPTVEETEPLPPEPPPAAETANPPVAEPPPARESTNTDRPSEQTELPPRRSYRELFEQTYAQEEPEKLSAAEKFRDTMSNVSSGVFANVRRLPPNTGRIVLVGVAAIILLILICWGITALYKATTPQPDAPKAPASAPTARSADSPKVSVPPKRATSREGVKPPPSKSGTLKSSGIQIPSLYID